VTSSEKGSTEVVFYEPQVPAVNDTPNFLSLSCFPFHCFPRPDVDADFFRVMEEGIADGRMETVRFDHSRVEGGE